MPSRQLIQAARRDSPVSELLLYHSRRSGDRGSEYRR